MAFPVLAYYVIFHYIPMAGTIIAFQDYVPIKGFLRSSFVGFKHFIDFFNGPYAWRVIRNTLLLNVYDIVFGFPLPILFALLINELRGKAFKKTVQTISYFPHFISLVVMCGIITDFSRTIGVFNSIAALFGAEPTNLLTVKEYFRPIFISTNIWKQLGWSSIIYLATLSGVDPTLYEAASMDGANRFRKILHVTLPALVPVIAIQLILRLGNILSQGFEKVILLYNPLTYETADVITSHVYRRGLEEMNYSYGAAVGLFNSVVNVIVLIAANTFSKRVVKQSLW